MKTVFFEFLVSTAPDNMPVLSLAFSKPDLETYTATRGKMVSFENEVPRVS
jgi:hypothetical protein